MNRFRLIISTSFTLSFAVILAAACGGGDSDDLSSPNPTPASCKTSDDCPAAFPVCDVKAGHCQVPTGCNSSLDCIDMPMTPICDPSSRSCVPCVDPADCEGTADCIKNQCVSYQACQTSLDCPQDHVCHSVLKRCVQCETRSDCPDGQVCIHDTCETRTECVSDNQCTPQGMLCDKILGYCVDCLTHEQCPSSHYCSEGICRLDECEPGEAVCKGNALTTCDPQGHAWTVSQACGVGTTCKASGKTASCAPWICNAGKVECAGSKVVECSSDGLSILSSVDCAASHRHCLDGACSDLVCNPNARFCDGNQLKQCNSMGSGFSVVAVCDSKQVCSPTAGACVTKVCEPDAPTCEGQVATKCNAIGDGYWAGGTNCAAAGKACSDGACLGCPAEGVAPTQVRMTEVFLGMYDYIVLKNQGNCPAQLQSLSLRIATQQAHEQVEFTLPSFLLDAGASVFVVDDGAQKSGDIVSYSNMYLTASTGEGVLLCQGPCSFGDILDYFAHGSGSPPPPPPLGVSFLPGPLTGITISTEDTKAYTRVAFSGSFPSFKATDWKEGPASRPHENATNCPPHAPTTGEPCNIEFEPCMYGTLMCVCLTSMWICQ